MLICDFSGGFDYGMGLLKAIPTIDDNCKWDEAIHELLDQIMADRDFFELSCINGNTMSSLKTRNTYGYVCFPDGRGMYYVRFAGDIEWHSLY